MKERKYKVLVTVLILALTAAVFTSCGSPKTLEDYINSNEDAKSQIESLNSDSENGMSIDVSIKENTLTYTFTYADTYDEEQAEQLSQYFEDSMSASAASFEGIAKSLEEESEIDGITVRVIYLDGNGTELYSQDFNSGE